MVYRFKLVSDDVSNFSREIEIDAESTFFQLRKTILESVGYNKDEYDTFFLCDDDWQREEEISLDDIGSLSDEDVWLMDTTLLSEMIDEEGQRLVFVFDYESDRCFFMEMKEMITGRSLAEGICTLKKGNAPKQIVTPSEHDRVVDIQKVVDSKDLDLNIDFYGDSDFNAEELEEGFDDMPMN